jgi:hypothetical protein
MRRVVTTLLFILLLSVLAFSSSAGAVASGATVKARVEQLAANDSRVRITLKNHHKLEGRILEIGENSFSFANRQTKTTETIAYEDVLSVRPVGMATATKVVIGIGVGAAIFTMVAILEIVHGLAG